MDSWWYFAENKERKSVSENGRSSGLMVSEESSSLVVDSSSRDWDSSSSIDLKLGNGEKSSESSISSSDKKRVKPFCLVYGCAEDLTSSKDYYKRHKVCEIHSKTVKVIVNGIEQRFCQQCSRFHILAEFDNTKRSCRKRLAGHNERRRKPRLGTLNSLGRVQDYNGPWFEDFTSIPSTLWQDTFLHQHKKFKVDSWNGAVPVEPNATLISPRQQQFPFHSSTIGAPNIDNVNDLPIENDFMYHNTYKSSHDSAGLKCSAQSSSFQAPSEPENSGCALYLLSTPSLKSANSPSEHPTAAGHKEGNCLPPFPISNVVDKVHNGVPGTMDCIIAHNHD